MYGKKRPAREPRRNQDGEGWVSIRGGFATRKCTIINISAGGACIRLQDHKFLTTPFYLKLSLLEQTGRRCRIAWQAGPIVGLEFMNPDQAAAEPYRAHACPGACRGSAQPAPQPRMAGSAPRSEAPSGRSIETLENVR